MSAVFVHAQDVGEDFFMDLFDAEKDSQTDPDLLLLKAECHAMLTEPCSLYIAMLLWQWEHSNRDYAQRLRDKLDRVPRPVEAT